MRSRGRLERLVGFFRPARSDRDSAEPDALASVDVAPEVADDLADNPYDEVETGP